MTPETASVALRSTRRTTIDELAAAQGVKLMVSTEELAFMEPDALVTQRRANSEREKYERRTCRGGMSFDDREQSQSS